MRTYYDDNYGHWDIEDEEDLEFYRQVTRESVMKTCKRCGGQFMLRPDYVICNSCADAMERGMDY